MGKETNEEVNDRHSSKQAGDTGDTDNVIGELVSQSSLYQQVSQSSTYQPDTIASDDEVDALLPANAVADQNDLTGKLEAITSGKTSALEQNNSEVAGKMNSNNCLITNHQD